MSRNIVEEPKHDPLKKLKAEYAINELKYKHGQMTRFEYLQARSVIVKRTRFLLDYEAMKSAMLAKRVAGTDKFAVDLVEEIMQDALPKLDPNKYHTAVSAVVEGRKDKGEDSE